MSIDMNAVTERIPVVTRPRLRGVDAARGIALLGMMAIHSLNLVNDDGTPTLPFTIAAGRAAALFAVLAGVGIAFMTGRAPVVGAKRLPTAAGLAGRALAIGAIGLLLGYTEGEYAVVILPYYSIMFLLAIPLVFLRTRVLVVLAGLVMVGVPALIELTRDFLPAPILENPSFVDVIGHPFEWIAEWTVTGEFPALPWLAYICAGIVIGRLRLTSSHTAAALLMVGTTVAVLSRIVSDVLILHAGGFDQIVERSDMTRSQVLDLLAYGADGSVATDTWWGLALAAPHTSMPLDLLGTIGSAAAVIGAMILLEKLTGARIKRLLTIVTTPLAAAGSMTLTLYVLHIWFINSDYDNYSANTGYVIQVIAVLSIGLFVELTAGRGPLEAWVKLMADRSKQAAANRMSTRRSRTSEH